MTLPAKFGGIVPPVCTPFTEDYEVDVSSLERLIAYQLKAGVHGVFMLGSTSETATLTDAQRETVTETAVRTVGGTVPVIAGIIDMSTARMIHHGEIAKRLGADALVSTGPFYISPSQSEIADHFRILRGAVDLPVIAYDIPQTTQIKLERETIVTLAREGVIAGIKDSSAQETNFRAMLIDTEDLDGFATFTGSESMVDALLQAGADGCVPGIGNVDPSGFVCIYNAVQSGDLDAARIAQNRLYRLFDIRTQAEPGRTGATAASLGSYKTALKMMGIIDTNLTARPMTRLNQAEAARIAAVLKDVELM